MSELIINKYAVAQSICQLVDNAQGKQRSPTVYTANHQSGETDKTRERLPEDELPESP